MIEGEAMKCGACGTSVTLGTTFCARCGQKLSDQEGATVLMTSHAPPSAAGKPGGSVPRSRTTAALLALLLGWVGGHKFYLGRVGQGVLYLLFFWTLIPLAVGVIEAVIYLSMSDEAFEKKLGVTRQGGQPAGANIGPGESKGTGAAASPPLVRRPVGYAAGCLGVIVVLGLISALVGELAPESGTSPTSRASAPPPAASQPPSLAATEPARVEETAKPRVEKHIFGPDWTIIGATVEVEFSCMFHVIGGVGDDCVTEAAKEVYKIAKEHPETTLVKLNVGTNPGGLLTDRYGKPVKERIFLASIPVQGLDEVRKYHDAASFGAEALDMAKAGRRGPDENVWTYLLSQIVFLKERTK